MCIIFTIDNHLQLNQAKENDELASVEMPPTMRKRGRPKGAGLTVIGLPKKKGNVPKVIPFIKKSEWEKTIGN